MEENDVLGGFSAVFDAISKQVDSSNSPADLDEQGLDRFQEDEPVDAVDMDAATSLDAEDNDEHVDDLNEENEPAATSSDNEDPGHDEQGESPVSAFFDAIAEAAGWELSDDEEKPKSAEELVEYMKSVVESSTRTDYADERIAEMNEYVKNGGTIENYIKETSGVADYNNLDISDQHTQKAVLREFLLEKGFTEQQIRRKIEKYEDADILEDEASDAVESLREIKEDRRKALLDEQKKSNQVAVEEQQKFYNNVVQEVEALTDIRGIQIPKADKQLLRDYIFKVDTDGRTKYQKDYASSLKNLIESAYFTMKGDALISTAKRSGETSAVEKLKNTLNSTKVSGSKQRINNRSAQPLWSVASSHLLRRPQ